MMRCTLFFFSLFVILFVSFPLISQENAAADSTAEAIVSRDAEPDDAPETVRGDSLVDDEENGGTPVAVDEVDDAAPVLQHAETSGDSPLLLEEDDGLLILDDDEELLIGKKPATTEIMEEIVDQEKMDSIAATIDPAQETVTQPGGEDFPETSEIVESEEPQGDPHAGAAKEKPARIATIEKTRSIDFAKNLKDYRSPKRALFMSLLLPGLGQAYSKKYLKTALFVSLEAALIGFAVKHGIDGRDKKEDARNFADKAFDVNKFLAFYEDFKKFAVAESIGVDSIGMITVFHETYEYYKQKYDGITSQSHDIDARKDFDDMIMTGIFVQGWKDCEPGFNENGYTFDGTYTYSYKPYSKDTIWQVTQCASGDTSSVIRAGIFGYSSSQNRYNRMISLSNHYYSVSRNLLFILVANHVASAVDAFISALAYNDRLMYKNSLWQKISIDHQVAMAPDGFHSRFGIRVRF